MSEAYKWLQTLPASIREEMKNMEQVVSLYLKAKRLGGALPSKEELAAYNGLSGGGQEAPTQRATSEFQNTLKTLRHELEQFDFSPNGQVATPEPHPFDGQNGQPLPQQLPLSPQAAPAAAAPHAHPHPQNNAAALMAALRLDPKSRQIVNEIREGLNLSSDVEVIRMSLVLAHKSLIDLLK